jgi:hypothetical protein
LVKVGTVPVLVIKNYAYRLIKQSNEKEALNAEGKKSKNYGEGYAHQGGGGR